MFVDIKYFSQDKNYLLKSVQAFSKEILLDEWINTLLYVFNIQHNPMNLEDDFIIELKNKLGRGKELLEDNYDIIAAIYRHNHSDNQLEIMWDGRSHMESYETNWKSMYSHWIHKLSLIKEVQRPVIKYAVSANDLNHTFLKQSIRKAILSYFGMKIKSKKIYQIAIAS